MDEPPLPATIVEIRSVGRGRNLLLALDDGREFTFSKDTCAQVGGCTVGATADEALLRALDEAEQRGRAHDVALRLLSTRARSEREMRTRLAMRGIGPEVAAEEIDRLRRAGLLDDQQFARASVEDRKRLAPRGRRMLRYELLGRGIAPESVDLVTYDIDDEETAIELARGRARGSAIESYDRFLSRVGGFLQRRGFDHSVVAKALRTVWAEVGARRGAEAEMADAEEFA